MAQARQNLAVALEGFAKRLDLKGQPDHLHRCLLLELSIRAMRQEYRAHPAVAGRWIVLHENFRLGGYAFEVRARFWFLVPLAIPSLFAQLGSITGRVEHPSGAVVPGGGDRASEKLELQIRLSF